MMTNIKNEDIKAEFRVQYNQLNKKDIIYIFFTSGLLYCLERCLQCIPKKINIVLIAAMLEDSEKQWLWEKGYSFIYFKENLTDVAIWDILLCENQYDFGWLDVDCFVNDPTLFDEMLHIRPNHIFNYIWSYDSYSKPSVRIINTYFLFVNINAAKKVMQKYELTSYLYTYKPNEAIDSKRCLVLNAKQKASLSLFLPDDFYTAYSKLTGGFFDSLELIQLFAIYEGYETHGVLDLTDKCCASVNMYLSDRIIHIGDINIFSSLKIQGCFLNQNLAYWLQIYIKNKEWILRTAILMLEKSKDYLPSLYTDLYKIVWHTLSKKFKIDIDQSEKWLLWYLQRENVSEKTIQVFMNIVLNGMASIDTWLHTRRINNTL